MNFILRLFSPNQGTTKSLFSNKISEIVGFTIGSEELYRQAFRHSSLYDNKSQNNERLEYLGDAILNSIISSHLYVNFSGRNEGFLTNMRAKIVSRSQLNILANKLDINRFIESRLDPSVNTSLGGNALEALIGAIYRDMGYDVAEKFVLEKMLLDKVDIKKLENQIISYKSYLIEYAQKEKISIDFSVISEEGENHNKLYNVELSLNNTVQGSGRASSKKKAEEQAAKKAYTNIILQ